MAIFHIGWINLEARRRKSWLSALAVAMAFGAARAEPDGFYTAKIRVDGMVCYSCSYGMEKGCKLKDLGVSYAMDLKKGLFKIELSTKEKVPSPSDFRRIVEDAGFTYRGAVVELEGEVQSSEGRYSVYLPASGQKVPVTVDRKMSNDVAKMRDRPMLLRLQASGKESAVWVLTAAKGISRRS